MISVAGLQLGGCESDLGLMASERGHHHYLRLKQQSPNQRFFFCQGRFNKNPRRGKKDWSGEEKLPSLDLMWGEVEAVLNLPGAPSSEMSFGKCGSTASLKTRGSGYSSVGVTLAQSLPLWMETNSRWSRSQDSPGGRTPGDYWRSRPPDCGWSSCRGCVEVTLLSSMNKHLQVVLLACAFSPVWRKGQEEV